MKIGIFYSRKKVIARIFAINNLEEVKQKYVRMLNKVNLYPANFSSHSFPGHEAFFFSQKLRSTFLTPLSLPSPFSSPEKNLVYSSRITREETVYST